MKPYRDMSDEEWQMVAPLLPELRPRSELRGRPLANTRAVLNGVLWVMYSGASWSTLPRKYPSYQTCHRRFKAWHDSGVLARVMQQLFGLASEGLYSLMTSRTAEGKTLTPRTISMSSVRPMQRTRGLVRPQAQGPMLKRT